MVIGCWRLHAQQYPKSGIITHKLTPQINWETYFVLPGSVTRLQGRNGPSEAAIEVLSRASILSPASLPATKIVGNNRKSGSK